MGAKNHKFIIKILLVRRSFLGYTSFIGLILLIALGISSASAQSDSIGISDSLHTKKHQILFESTNLIFSSSINTNVQGALIGLRPFPNQVLSEIESRERHYLVSDLNYRLSYFRKDSKKGGFNGISMFWRQSLSAGLNDDFLRLILAGNSQFAGDTAFIDQSLLHSQQYVSLGVFYSHSIAGEKNNWLFTIQPQLLVGLSDWRISASESWLYTAQYGESLELAADYSYHSNYKRPGGVGLGLNAEVRWIKPFKWMAVVQLQDLGYIYWSKSSDKIENISQLQYDGISIPTLSDLSHLKPDSVIADELIDPLYSDVLQQASYNSGTMPSVNASIHRMIGKSTLNLSLKQYLHSARVNLSTLSYNFPLIKHWHGTLRGGLVSFERPFAGISVSYHSPGGTMLHLGLSDLTSLIRPENSYIQSVYLSFHYTW